MIISPVFVAGWDDDRKTFDIDFSPATLMDPAVTVAETTLAEKRYGIRLVASRLHQARFREAVLAAYQNRCAVCELQVRPLLEGAHIIPDSDPLGDPVVQNGLSLCALHHRAFDRRILCVNGDFRVEIDQASIPSRDREARRSLLDHHGRPIRLPKDRRLWPDRERLARAG